MSKPLKTVPKFANETEERAFWEQHDSTDYLDWTKAQRIVLPQFKTNNKNDFIATSLTPSRFNQSSREFS